MRELAWVDSALDDIVRLRRVVAKENPKVAQRVAETIKEAALKLREFPELGKPVMNLIQYRDLHVRFGAGGYIIRYRLHLEFIYIVHIRHYREMDFH